MKRSLLLSSIICAVLFVSGLQLTAQTRGGVRTAPATTSAAADSDADTDLEAVYDEIDAENQAYYQIAEDSDLNSYATANVGGGDFDVCPGGCDFTSIQDAVNAAAEGDTITIGNGVYEEKLDITKNITLIGQDAGGTAIDPNLDRTCDQPFSEPVVKVRRNKIVSISNIQIRGGFGSAAGGVVNKGHLTLDNVKVWNNIGVRVGGILNVKAHLEITNSRIFNNTTLENLGVGQAGGIASIGAAKTGEQSTLILTDSQVDGNYGKRGGGIFSRRSDTIIDNSDISWNTSEQQGGGIFHDCGPLQLNDSKVTFNTSRKARGGGLFNGREGVTNGAGAEINLNTAQTRGGGYANPHADGQVTLDGASTVLYNKTNSGVSMECFDVNGGCN